MGTIRGLYGDDFLRRAEVGQPLGSVYVVEISTARLQGTGTICSVFYFFLPIQTDMGGAHVWILFLGDQISPTCGCFLSRRTSSVMRQSNLITQ